MAGDANNDNVLCYVNDHERNVKLRRWVGSKMSVLVTTLYVNVPVGGADCSVLYGRKNENLLDNFFRGQFTESRFETVSRFFTTFF